PSPRPESFSQRGEGAASPSDIFASKPTRVSVIIPMGRPDRVASTLASLANQNPKPAAWEVVLVGVEAESVARAHPHLPVVPVVLEKNVLPPRTRCLGVERATGDWLLFLDDDVELAPDCHARFADLLSTPDFSAAASPAVGAIGFRLPGKTGRFFEKLTDISNFWAQQHGTAEDRDWLYSAALLVRAEAYHRSGGFNPELPNGEDVDLTRRIAAAGYRLRYEPGLVARHDHRRDTLFAMWRYFWKNGNAARHFFAAHGGACPFSIKTVWLKAWSDLQMNRAFQQKHGVSLGLQTPLIWLNYLIVEASLDWHWQQYLKEEKRYRTFPARAPSDTTYVLAMTAWEEGRKITGVLRYTWAVLEDFDNPVRR
ncbi:MAG: glycosyltransferase, partial [Opitutus sp.]